MFGGETQSRDINGWRVSWESLDGHRFWCEQEHPSNSLAAAVVMLNPGSLSGNGDGLSQDTTLRILREIFAGTSYNPFVINLFTLATAKPSVLFEKWARRDHLAFKYGGLPLHRFSAVMYAYGDYENGEEHSSEIKTRIVEVRACLKGVHELVVPTNKSGTPKHPLPIQRQNLKDTFKQAILAHASAGQVGERTANMAGHETPASARGSAA